MTARVALALLVSLLAAACQRTGDAAHYQRVRSLCDAVVADHGTAAEAERAFGAPADETVCSGLEPLGASDACPYAEAGATCGLRWTWLANDGSLCGTGCRYGCELRLPAAALGGASCAGQFLPAIPPGG